MPEFDLFNENAILEGIKKGNRKIWAQVISAFYEPIFYFILGMVKQKEMAEELTQDVFANFWIKREDINIETSLKSYLYRFARNHTLNFIKRSKFELDYYKNLSKTLTEHHTETEDNIQFTELDRLLKKEIENLPEECREIFKLSRYEELSYKEIADTLEIPVRRVHYQIGIALKTIREKLKKQYGKEFFPVLLIVFMYLLNKF
ncbi:RNA polymerase sigma-70 factor [Chondrinema litorale]|uniref:RNA polymerase sigma-70 factor n=1 Tax=Chondrinema litorale TaxID=2994555 RepID=UPI002543E27E|nr:RNA polymerase sigma-70 factor [Chondrinema litorale]UZR95832.1 RNA polymerase sigma-70 factor [Chondrinema litorale]